MKRHNLRVVVMGQARWAMIVWRSWRQAKKSAEYWGEEFSKARAGLSERERQKLSELITQEIQP